jgi:hypothetical protein
VLGTERPREPSAALALKKLNIFLTALQLSATLAFRRAAYKYYKLDPPSG